MATELTEEQAFFLRKIHYGYSRLLEEEHHQYMSDILQITDKVLTDGCYTSLDAEFINKSKVQWVQELKHEYIIRKYESFKI